MNDWVYPRERTLGGILLVLGLLIWLALLVGTLGGLLLFFLFAFIAYVFAHSAFIAYIKGNGVKLSPQQFPDLHARFVACCQKLGISTPPEAYVLHGDGLFNAFATRFLGRHYVVLLSEVVDAMAKHPDGVDFYIGHELGHVRMNHLTGQLWRWPALWLPLLGAAYSRAQESTCDRHGRACSSSPENAARALLALAAGPKRWTDVDIAQYGQQAQATRGFWMSYHELTGGYPWLTKRVLRVMDPSAPMPRRHALAYVFALFVPNSGRFGGALAPLVALVMIGVLAAVALPAYQDYKSRAELSSAYVNAQAATSALAAHYLKSGEIPDSLQAIGVDPDLPGGGTMTVGENMVLTVKTASGGLVLEPRIESDDDEETEAAEDEAASEGEEDATPSAASDDDSAVKGRIVWTCKADNDTPERRVPKACRSGLESLFSR